MSASIADGPGCGKRWQTWAQTPAGERPAL